MKQNLFDRIGSGLRSLGIVIFAMLMIIAAMVFFSHTLFGDVFPDTMKAWEKHVATWAMALSWELTVLITTVNAHHIGRWVPKMMGICSGVIVLLFIGGFSDSLTPMQQIERAFVGGLAAYINYVYAELFNKKWHERHQLQSMPFKLKEAEAKADQLEATLLESASKLKDAEAKLADQEAELTELRQFKADYLKSLECPYCGVGQPSPDALRAHKGHCKSNPKKGVRVNGTAVTA